MQLMRGRKWHDNEERYFIYFANENVIIIKQKCYVELLEENS
jgi:hypothetical protein